MPAGFPARSSSRVSLSPVPEGDRRRAMRMKRIALRLSPSGTGDRLTRLLDLAGNPAGMTLERLLGFKGAGLLLGGFLGLFYGGVSLRGFLFGALGATGGFLLPDLLV